MLGAEAMSPPVPSASPSVLSASGSALPDAAAAQQHQPASPSSDAATPRLPLRSLSAMASAASLLDKTLPAPPPAAAGSPPHSATLPLAASIASLSSAATPTAASSDARSATRSDEHASPSHVPQAKDIPGVSKTSAETQRSDAVSSTDSSYRSSSSSRGPATPFPTTAGVAPLSRQASSSSGPSWPSKGESASEHGGPAEPEAMKHAASGLSAAGAAASSRHSNATSTTASSQRTRSDSRTSMRSRTSRASSAASQHSVPRKLSDAATAALAAELPDPSTFPIPASVAMPPVSPVVGRRAGSGSFGTPAHSQCSSEHSSRLSRGSFWTEKSSQHSSTMTSPGSSFLQCADSSVDVSVDSPSSVQSADGVGLGITADRARGEGTVGRSRLESAGAGTNDSTPPVSLSRPWAHHRAPSWTRRPLPPPPTSQSADAVAAEQPSSPSSPGAVGAETPVRPGLTRLFSENSSLVRPPLLPPLLPAHAVPVRNESRNRTISARSRNGSKTSTTSQSSSSRTADAQSPKASRETQRRPHTATLAHRPSLAFSHSGSSTSDVEMIRTGGGSPVTPNAPTARSRSSSLRHAASSIKLSSRSSDHNLAATVSPRTPALRHDSKRSFGPMEHLALFDHERERQARERIGPSDYSQEHEVVPPSAGSTSSGGFYSTFRRWRAGSITSERSFGTSGRQARATEDDDDGNMSDSSSDCGYTYTERGSGAAFERVPASLVEHFKEQPLASLSALPDNLVEAAGRPLSAFEHLVRPSTTHLVLRGCRDERLGSWLQRTLPTVARSLLVLDVANTSLTALPSTLGLCSALEELDVSGNRMDAGLSPIVGQLLRLRVLTADDIGALSLPRALADLADLRSLSVSYNYLSHLPTWLHRLPLERLRVDENPFQGAWAKVGATLLSPGKGFVVPSSAVAGAASAPAEHAAFVGSYDDGTRLSSPEAPQSAPAQGRGSVPQDGTIGRAAARSTKAEASRHASVPDARAHSGAPALNTDAHDDRIRRAHLTVDTAALRRPDTAERAADHRKWSGFLRKVGRKSSSAGLSVMTNSEPPTRGPSPNPKLAPIMSQQALDAMASGGAPLRSPASQRPSVSSTASQPADHVQPEEDREAHAARVRAILHYLRDLHDLSRKTESPLSTDSSPTHGERSFTPLKSPPSLEQLRKRPSLQQLMNISNRPGCPRNASGLSNGSATPTDVSVAAEEPIRYKDDSVRRMRIVREIIVTEETYVKQLEELVNIYVTPSRAVDREGAAFVPPAEHRLVFNNVESILHLHANALLPSLKAAAAPLLSPRNSAPEASDVVHDAAVTGSVAVAVAQVFERHTQWFKMYQQYVNGLEGAQTRISSWSVPAVSTAANAFKAAAAAGLASGFVAQESTASSMSPKERKRLKAFMQRAKADPRHSQLSVESYLLLPVQRIPRYKLLIADLVRSTPPECVKGADSMVNALDAITILASSVNESKRQSEQDRKLLAWQARIKGRWPSPLVQPHRRLLMDGGLVLKRVVQRTRAFHVPAASWGSPEDLMADGAAETTPFGLVQVDCLQQQSMSKYLQILLCNDFVVAVTDPSQGRDEASSVELYTVLHPQQGKPVSVYGHSNLRIVDAKNILYFAAPSAEAAAAWCEVMNEQFM